MFHVKQLKEVLRINQLNETLISGALELGITLGESEVKKFKQYANFLVEYNEKVNLTAITEPKEIAIKHFIDSLAIIKYCDLKLNDKLADIGAGAGFPSVPIKIVRDDISISLFDSLNKRVIFLKELLEKLDLKGEAIHQRAQDAGQNPEYRESFDVVTARAVASFRELTEYCLPLVKVGGVFIALKGIEIDTELNQAQNAISILGGEVEKCEKYSLPDKSGRSIVIIRKISQTPLKYPRLNAKITKNPL